MPSPPPPPPPSPFPPEPAAASPAVHAPPDEYSPDILPSFGSTKFDAAARQPGVSASSALKGGADPDAAPVPSVSLPMMMAGGSQTAGGTQVAHVSSATISVSVQTLAAVLCLAVITIVLVAAWINRCSQRAVAGKMCATCECPRRRSAARYTALRSGRASSDFVEHQRRQDSRSRRGR
mmetsp:Transcript_92701/g.278128  ORF Transcript_92701/g.278128 Transcript_92701/m.278128 type:complete len:179 (+) Transcript_92701:3-539(+)